jgi:hypothetical protein
MPDFVRKRNGACPSESLFATASERSSEKKAMRSLAHRGALRLSSRHHEGPLELVEVLELGSRTGAGESAGCARRSVLQILAERSQSMRPARVSALHSHPTLHHILGVEHTESCFATIRHGTASSG